MNRRALVLGAAAVAVAAFAGAAALYRKPEPPAPAAPPQAAGADNPLIRAHAPVIGPADAPVTLVEFLDPSCEACRAFYPYVKKILSDHPNDVKLVVRYAPLHQGSDEAVRILEASRLQGKFDDVMMALFRDQPEWAQDGSPNLDRAWEIAGAAGLDVSKAREDAKLPAIAKVLEQDMADLQAVNLQGTPTFYINGKPLAKFGTQELMDAVAAEVKAVKGGAAGS